MTWQIGGPSAAAAACVVGGLACLACPHFVDAAFRPLIGPAPDKEASRPRHARMAGVVQRWSRTALSYTVVYNISRGNFFFMATAASMLILVVKSPAELKLFQRYHIGWSIMFFCRMVIVTAIMPNAIPAMPVNEKTNRGLMSLCCMLVGALLHTSPAAHLSAALFSNATTFFRAAEDHQYCSALALCNILSTLLMVTKCRIFSHDQRSEHPIKRQDSPVSWGSAVFPWALCGLVWFPMRYADFYGIDVLRWVRTHCPLTQVTASLYLIVALACLIRPCAVDAAFQLLVGPARGTEQSRKWNVEITVLVRLTSQLITSMVVLYHLARGDFFGMAVPCVWFVVTCCSPDVHSKFRQYLHRIAYILCLWKPLVILGALPSAFSAEFAFASLGFGALAAAVYESASEHLAAVMLVSAGMLFTTDESSVGLYVAMPLFSFLCMVMKMDKMRASIQKSEREALERRVQAELHEQRVENEALKQKADAEQLRRQRAEMEELNTINHAAKRTMSNTLHWVRQAAEMAPTGSELGDVISAIERENTNGIEMCRAVLMRRQLGSGLYSSAPHPAQLRDEVAQFAARQNVNVKIDSEFPSWGNSIILQVKNQPGPAHGHNVDLQSTRGENSLLHQSESNIYYRQKIGHDDSTFQGLKEVKEAAEAMGAASRLFFRKDAVLFSLTLPLVLSKDPAAVHEASDAKRLVFVLVDDDNIMRMMYGLFLKLPSLHADLQNSIILGETFQEAHTMPEVAMELALAVGQDRVVCIIDQNMEDYIEGKVYGTDLTRRLRNLGFSGSVFIRSANDDSYSQDRFVKAGATGALSKCLNGDALVATVLAQIDIAK